MFLVLCVLEMWCGWIWVGWNLQHGYYSNPTAPDLQHTANQEQNDNVVIEQHSRKLLMMDILMSKTCWVHKKWNKIASDIKLVFYSSASVGIVMCTVGSYRLNQTEMAKEIPSVMMWRTGTFPNLKKKTDCLEMDRKRDIYGDVWCWFLGDCRIQDHSQPFLNKNIPLCCALGVYLIWKIAVLCHCQM